MNDLPFPVPNHFLDEEIKTALKAIIKVNSDQSDLEFIYNDLPNSSLPHKKYNLTCGLLTKLRNNVDRLKKRSLVRHYEKLKSFSISKLLLHLLLYFTTDYDSNDISHAIQNAFLNGIEPPSKVNDTKKTNFAIFNNSDSTLLNQKSYLLNFWDDITLFEASEELICKGIISKIQLCS